MTKKTILVLTIIAALIIALWKWLTSDKEQKQETTEEVKEPANNETENVKGLSEEAKADDTVENHK
mgnify:CR=1 FL=1